MTHTKRNVLGGALLIATLVLVGLVGCGSRPGGETATVGGSSDAANWDEHTHGLPFIVGYAAGMEKAKQADKPALVFATTTWCGWCKKLAGESFDDPAVRERLDKFQLVLVDGDVETDVCAELGVRGFPAIILKRPDERTFGRVNGYVPKDEFLRILDESLAKEA